MAATVRDSQATIASGTSIDADVPASAQSGDVLVAATFGYGTDGAMTAPAGWTAQATAGTTSGFNAATRAKLWVKDDAYNGTDTDYTFNQGVSDQFGVLMIAVSGADTADPVDGTVPTPATSPHTAEFTTINAPAVSPTGTDSLLLCFYAAWPSNGGGSWTLTGLTETMDSSTWDFYAAGYDELDAAGSTGTRQGAAAVSGVAGLAGLSIAIASADTATEVEPNDADLAVAADNVALITNPTVDAGDDLTIGAGESPERAIVVLDDGGDTPSLSWGLVSAPSGHGLVTAQNDPLDVAHTVPGTYVWRAQALNAVGFGIDTFTLTVAHVLAPADAALAPTADSPTLTENFTVAPADAALAIAADSPDAAEDEDDHTVEPADAALAVSADSPTLTESQTVTPDDASLAVSADAPDADEVIVVVLSPVDDASMTLSVDSPTVTQTHTLSPADASLAVSADAPTATQTHILTADDAALALSADVPTVTPAGEIDPADAAVAITADEPALTQHHTLTVDDASLAVAADTPTITPAGSVVPDPTTLAVAADEPTLTQQHTIAPNDAALGLSADEPTFGQGSTVTPDDASLALSADAPTVTQSHTIVPESAAVTTTAAEPSISQLHILDPADADLTLAAASPAAASGVVPPPASRTFLRPREVRVYAVPARDRTST